MIVLRHVIGDELRRRRQDQGRTLRDVSAAAAAGAAAHRACNDVRDAMQQQVTT